MSTKTYPDTEELAGQLHSVATRLLRTLRRADTASGSTAPRLSALSVIVFNGAVTLGELADAEQVRPPSMTRIVNALEHQKLVVKTKDGNDGRRIRIRATVRGKKLLLQSRARRVQMLADQIALIAIDGQTNLISALITIQDLIDRIAAR
jgi:DNA-binding MarR family transcriptional regulator